jgi:universal stress protein A
MNTFLVPIDFSDVTEKTIRTAISLAKDRKAKLIFLYIVYPTPSIDGLRSTAEEIGKTLAEKEERARLLLRAVKLMAKDNGIAAEYQMGRGSVASQIVHYAGEFDTDLIVMGSHGHSAMYDFIVGSTTNTVLKAAPCAVTIVPADKKAIRKRRRNFLHVETLVD